MNKNFLLEKIDNAKQLSFGDIFNESIELFKKVWMQGFVKTLLQMILGLVIALLSYIPIFMVLGFFGVTFSIMGERSAPVIALPMVVLIIAIFILIIIVAGVVPMALIAGFYRICKQKDLNEATSDDYFYFLKRRYFKKMATLVAASIGISLLATLLCYFPVFFVMIPITFFTIIFAFNPELSASDIISVGFKLGVKKWGITFALVLVSGFAASIIGFILCGIGIFFTSSFIYLPIYFVYKHVIGFEDDYRVYSDDLKQIEQ
ncbi:hypothetical protein [Kordia sp.]|uniref:hypothetical protein n=1 Tax=Kordia sp. TaxID=1965332 RepID=UPI003D26D657